MQDVNTGRVLVLKRSSLQSHEGRVVYEKEASVMRGLAHPNIVQVGWRPKELVVHAYRDALKVAGVVV